MSRLSIPVRRASLELAFKLIDVRRRKNGRLFAVAFLARMILSESGYSNDAIRTILSTITSLPTRSPYLPSASVSREDITRASHNSGKTGSSCLTMRGRTAKRGHGSTSMPGRWRRSSTVRSPELRPERTFRALHHSLANPRHRHLDRTTQR